MKGCWKSQVSGQALLIVLLNHIKYLPDNAQDILSGTLNTTEHKKGKCLYSRKETGNN